ncbi:MAG: cytochrome c biogenesis protein [Planctomycetes bacterium]|nr:cytochrome c biogenesis protein [Planctomycetota bacterium]
MLNVTVFCFLASYLCALGVEWRRLYHRTPWNRALVLLFGAAGLVAHTIYLGNRAAQTNLPPLLSSTHDWMLVLAWMVVLVYLFLALFDRTLAIGLFLLPMVLGLVGAAYFVSRDPNAVVAAEAENMARVAGRVWTMLHATLLVFGIAAVMFGFVLSLMYLVQHHRLKRKHGRHDLTLPNLERLARLNEWAVLLSVPLLTLGMLSGVGLGWQMGEGSVTVSFNDPVVIGSGVAWLILMAFFVWFSQTSRRRTSGKQVAWLTLAAFGFLLVTILGLQVLSGRLGESWHA